MIFVIRFIFGTLSSQLSALSLLSTLPSHYPKLNAITEFIVINHFRNFRIFVGMVLSSSLLFSHTTAVHQDGRTKLEATTSNWPSNVKHSNVKIQWIGIKLAIYAKYSSNPHSISIHSENQSIKLNREKENCNR